MSFHTDMATMLRHMATAVLKLHADLEAMEKIARQGPRPDDCVWHLGEDPQQLVGGASCPVCWDGPCPWGRPLQPGEVIE